MYRFDVKQQARACNWFTFKNWLTAHIGPMIQKKSQTHGRFNTYIGEGWSLRLVYGKRPQRQRWNIVQAIVVIEPEHETEAVMFKLQWM
jgi:hypothetical protein